MRFLSRLLAILAIFSICTAAQAQWSNRVRTVAPEGFGAVGDGVAWDTDAMQAAVNAAAKPLRPGATQTGGVVHADCTKKYRIKNLQIPAGVTLEMCLPAPDNPGGINTSQDYSTFGGLRLSGASASTTASTAYNSKVVVVASAAGIERGMTFEHSNIPGGAYIEAVDGTSLTLSEQATATTGATITSCQINTIAFSTYLTLSNCVASSAGIGPHAVIAAAGVPGGAEVVGIDAQNNVIMSAAATATALSVSASFANPASPAAVAYNSITLGPAAGVMNALVYRDGMTFPAADASAYSGVAFRCGYKADGCFVRDTLAVGFQDAFISKGATEYAFANSRVKIHNLAFDAVGGVVLHGSFDTSDISGRGWPYGTVGNGSLSTQARTGSCFLFRGTNDNTELDGFCNGHNRGADIVRSSGIKIRSFSTDHQGQLPNSVGIYTGLNTDRINVDNLDCIGNDVCIDRNANPTEKMVVGALEATYMGHEAVRVNGGDLEIGGACRISNTGLIAASPAFNIGNASSFVRAKCLMSNISSGYPVAAGVALQTDRVKIDAVIPDAAAGTQTVGANPHTWPTIASADPLNLPANGHEFFVAGGVPFSTIVGGNSGRHVRLHFLEALTLYYGANLTLPNAAHLAMPASSWADFTWNSATGKWTIGSVGSDSTAPFATSGMAFRSIKEWGAVGDGVLSTQTGTDNTLAFNRALSDCASRCSIYVEPGVYIFNSPIFYSGPGHIDIHFAAGAYIVASAAWDKINANGLFVLQSYGANEAAYTGTGGDPALRQSIRLTGGGRFDCRNTRPEGTGAGSSCIRVNGNSWRGVYFEGIEVSGTGFDAIGEPYEWSPATGSDTGFQTMGGSEITFRNVKAYGFKDGGLYLGGDFDGECDSILVEGVYTDRANFGIAVKRPCKRVRIINNQVRRGTTGISLLFANSGATNGAPPTGTIIAGNAVNQMDKAFRFQQQDRLLVYGNHISELGITDDIHNTSQGCGFLLEGVTNSEFRDNVLTGPQTLYPGRFANNSTSFALGCMQTFNQTIAGSPVSIASTGNRFVGNRSPGLYAGFVEADASQDRNFYEGNEVEGATVPYALKGYTSQWRDGAGVVNFVRNGDFSISRRGSSFAPAAATDTPISDSWWYHRTNAGVTVSTGADATGDYLQIQRDTGNTTVTTARLWQQWPSDIVRKMAGKPITCMYYAQAGADQSAPSLNVAIWSGTGVNEVGGNASFPTGAVGINVPRGDALTTSWKRYLTTTYTLPANASEALLIFSWAHAGTAGANDWIQLSKIRCAVGGYVPNQGEAGFDLAGRETELPKLLQYLQTIQIQTENGTKSVQFSPPMFATPAVSTTAGSVANATPDSVDLTHTTAAAASVVAHVNGF